MLFRTYQNILVGFLLSRGRTLKKLDIMKKFIYTLALIFALGISFNSAQAADKPAKNPTELTAEQAVKLERIKTRVEEIRDMDKSNLTKAERKALRSELRELKGQARAVSGGVYLSVGAIIIIILLLILIL
jgi:flagellar motility protein MotE (MotC chaperone)